MMKTILLIVTILVSLACGTTPPGILASTPFPEDEVNYGTLPAPGERLILDFTPPPWAPEIIGGSNSVMLADALAERKAIFVMTGKNMQKESWDDRIFQMVKSFSPNTAIVSRADDVLHGILLEKGEVPFRRTFEPGGTDMFGRPYMIPRDHPLHTEWLSRKTALKGADALLILDIIRPDTRKMKELRARRSGSCKDWLHQMNDTVTRAQPYFDPLTSRLNKALGEEFSRQMGRILPFWTEELETAMTRTAPDTTEARCYQAYQKMLHEYEPCENENCRLAPSFYSVTDGIIGLDLSHGSRIPSGCPVAMGRNYVQEIQETGRRTVDAILHRIPAEWAGELARIRALTTLISTMESVCKPAHRRYTGENLRTANDDVSALLGRIAEINMTGEWVSTDGQQRIAGIGNVTILARAESRHSPLQADLTTVTQQLRSLDHCRDSRRRPVQAALIDVGTSEVFFSAIVFEEELFCEDLSPLRP